ncbi:MAG TPA: hypothetical protein ENN13_00875 [Candidatus Altiarchaeales archaeon]|nr:hypothetical protein [Candidatus Altiarchaeales archaeon]
MPQSEKPKTPLHKLPKKLKKLELEQKIEEVRLAEIEKSNRRLRERIANLQNPGPSWGKNYVGYLESQKRFKKLEETNPKRLQAAEKIHDSEHEKEWSLRGSLLQIKEEIADGRKRLEDAFRKIPKLRERRKLTQDFIQNPQDPTLFTKFVEFKAGQWLEELESKGIGPSATDAILNAPEPPRYNRYLDQPLPEKRRAGSTERTLAALTAYLATTRAGEINLPSGRPSEQLSKLLNANNIKNILEVGTSDWGLVHILHGLDVARRAGARLYSLNYDEKRSAHDTDGAVFQARFGDAEHAPNIYPDVKFDLILLQGVLSFGGIIAEGGDKAEERLDYSPKIGKAHRVLNALSQTLSPNPNAAIIASAIRGSLAIRQDVQTEGLVLRQRTPLSEDAKSRQKQKLVPPEISDGLGYTRKAGHDFRNWHNANEQALGRINEFLEQASGIAVYQRKLEE